MWYEEVAFIIHIKIIPVFRIKHYKSKSDIIIDNNTVIDFKISNIENCGKISDNNSDCLYTDVISFNELERQPIDINDWIVSISTGHVDNKKNIGLYTFFTVINPNTDIRRICCNVVNKDLIGTNSNVINNEYIKCYKNVTYVKDLT